MPRPLPIFTPNQITWSGLLIWIYILNGKQCRSRAVGFFRSQLILIYTVFKGRVYPGSAGPGLNIDKYAWTIIFRHTVRQSTFGYNYAKYVFRKLRVIVKGMNILASQATLSKPLGTKVYSKRMEFANRSLLQKNGIRKQKSTPKERNLQTEVYSKKNRILQTEVYSKRSEFASKGAHSFPLEQTPLQKVLHVQESRGGSRGMSEGVRFSHITVLYIFGQTGLSKQCRPRSDAAKRGVWSGSTLLATHPAILYTFTGSKLTCWREV